jgi:hypothetical protein
MPYRKTPILKLISNETNSRKVEFKTNQIIIQKSKKTKPNLLMNQNMYSKSNPNENHGTK